MRVIERNDTGILTILSGNVSNIRTIEIAVYLNKVIDNILTTEDISTLVELSNNIGRRLELIIPV